MGWNGSGTCTLTDGTFTSDWAQGWSGDGDPKIKDTDHDLLLTDVQASIHACLAKNGENAATADLDGGGFRFTNLSASGNTDAALHGDVIASGAVSGTDIVLTQNDGTTITVDAATLSAGTGGVALTGDQAITGNKAFASLRINGQTKTKVLAPTPGSSVTVDTTAGDVHYVTVGTNTDVTFTWPTAASDAQLGTHWVKRGHILFRHTGASYTITLNATMLAALDDYSTEGTNASGSGDISTLTYCYYYLDGTVYAQFAWVATP